MGWEIGCYDCCGQIIVNALSKKKNREDFSLQTVKRKINSTVVFKEAFKFLVAKDSFWCRIHLLLILSSIIITNNSMKVIMT